MPITKESLIPLIRKGLYISDPYPANHAAYPSGYQIMKTNTVKGNSLPVYKALNENNQQIDAPVARIHEKNNEYIFTICENMPGPSAELGDFTKIFTTLREAIDAILDYYFGDPTAMYKQMGPNLFAQWQQTKRPISDLYKEWQEAYPMRQRKELKRESLYIKELVNTEHGWTAIIATHDEDEIVAYIPGSNQEQARRKAESIINSLP